MSGEVYKKFLREEWLAKKYSKRFNPERPYGTDSVMLNIMDQKAIEDGGLNTWHGKFYPETRDENVKILDDYLTLCEKNNARPIMFRVPVTEKFMANFNKQVLDEFSVLVEQACQKHPSARMQIFVITSMLMFTARRNSARILMTLSSNLRGDAQSNIGS